MSFDFSNFVGSFTSVLSTVLEVSLDDFQFGNIIHIGALVLLTGVDFCVILEPFD